SGAVGQAIPHAQDSANGGKVDDDSLLPRNHGGKKGLSHIKDAAHVHGVEPIEVGAIRLEKCADMANPGVVDEDVQASLTLVNAPGSSRASLFTRHIQLKKLSLAAFCFQPGGCG